MKQTIDTTLPAVEEKAGIEEKVTDHGSIIDKANVLSGSFNGKSLGEAFALVLGEDWKETASNGQKNAVRSVYFNSRARDIDKASTDAAFAEKCKVSVGFTVGKTGSVATKVTLSARNLSPGSDSYRTAMSEADRTQGIAAEFAAYLDGVNREGSIIDPTRVREAIAGSGKASVLSAWLCARYAYTLPVAWLDEDGQARRKSVEEALKNAIAGPAA